MKNVKMIGCSFFVEDTNLDRMRIASMLQPTANRWWEIQHPWLRLNGLSRWNSSTQPTCHLCCVQSILCAHIVALVWGLWNFHIHRKTDIDKYYFKILIHAWMYCMCVCVFMLSFENQPAAPPELRLLCYLFNFSFICHNMAAPNGSIDQLNESFFLFISFVEQTSLGCWFTILPMVSSSFGQ